MDVKFKKEYFDLMQKYAGTKYDFDNAEHVLARDKLKEAYEATKEWADKVQLKLFPGGDVKIRRNPVNQGMRFEDYNWAKIYPDYESLKRKEIAYTIGMHGPEPVGPRFIIKFDTINKGDHDELRKEYLRLRGDLLDSNIVYTLSRDEGLSMSLDELVDWTVEKIKLLEPHFKQFSEWKPEPINTLESHINALNDGNSNMDESKPLNQILYGPPGTGKTYHTINKALSILAPEFLSENTDRKILKERFDELKKEGRIGFVTFHQSFSYEDFVEGLRAEASEEGINYYVEPGIFKELCKEVKTDNSSDDIDTAIAKLAEQLEEEPLRLKTSTGKSFMVSYRGGKTFRIKPESSDKDDDYPASIERIKRVYHGGSLKDVYNPSYVLAVLNHLKTTYSLGEKPIATVNKPAVLIIDEINRGNTANIFGELITLIEPSKRRSAKEALQVKLPYSKELFDVPDNLYIIGTMNTADRSLALLDTALRRRFQFEFMGPDIQVLIDNDINEVEGINIPLMLKTINQRIELLYDKNHTIGHSFFLELKNDKTISKLAEIFDRQILPLLEEYFFEDWSKIQQVLGDHLKSNNVPKFIVSAFNDSNDVTKLLGEDVAEILGESAYKRNDEALNDVSAYISIYQRD